MNDKKVFETNDLLIEVAPWSIPPRIYYLYSYKFGGRNIPLGYRRGKIKPGKELDHISKVVETKTKNAQAAFDEAQRRMDFCAKELEIAKNAQDAVRRAKDVT